MLFITIHQVYELWFQQLLHEAQTARDAMYADQLWWAKHLLKRAHVIERVLVEQVDVLETMTPQDFLAFRQLLSPASGFQSVQYRELEFLSGAKDPSFVRAVPRADRRRASAASAATRGADALGCLRRRPRTSRTGDRRPTSEIRASLRTAAHNRSEHFDVWELAEALIQHDELAAAWRARHVTMVERMIGTKTGTGGSSGSGYLRSRLPLRYYPLLWDLRSELEPVPANLPG